MNINSLNNVQDFSVLKNNKTDNTATNPNSEFVKNQKEERQKQTLDAKTALANYTLPKRKMSFKGNLQQEEMSDEEFKKLKKQLNEKIKTLPENLQSETYYWMLTKNNINFAKIILFNEKFYKKIFMSSKVLTCPCYPPIENKTTPLAYRILDKISSNKELLNNDNFINNAGIFINLLNDEKQFIFLEKIMANSDLCKSKIFVENIHNLIGTVHKNEAVKLSEKIISDKNLYDNKKFMPYAGSILQHANNEYQIEMIVKILYNENLCNNENFLQNASYFLSSIDSYDKKVFANKILSDKNLYDNEKFMPYAGSILQHANNEYQIEMIAKILYNENLRNNEIFLKNIEHFISLVQNEKHLDMMHRILSDKNLQNIENRKKIVINNSQLYINGQFYNKEKILEKVDKFFNKNYLSLLIASSVFDNRTMDTLLRMRFEKAEEYLSSISSFNGDDIELLFQLSNSYSDKGEKFSEKEKIEFIDIIKEYKNFGIDFSMMKKMIHDNKINVDKLKSKLFEIVLTNCGLKKKEIFAILEDKSTSWNMKYMHLLPKQIEKNKKNNDNSLIDLLRVSNLGKFRVYIQDKKNKYGRANANTEKMFKENGMNYKAWLNQSKENNVKFVSKNKNEEQLQQIKEQVKEDMGTLMKTPVKVEIRKHFPYCVKDDKFIIPNKYKTKEKLYDFTVFILEKFGYMKKGEKVKENEIDPKSVYGRAINNRNNPNKKEMANRTLTIINLLNQRLENISKVNNIEIEKIMDITIKMWERNPQKDLFQGNYSTCCIGMGNGNGWAMPHYIMNTAFNMIEMVDNETGKVIGNALCYFVKDEYKAPAFIIDNIEINNNYKPSTEAGKKLRSKIKEYALNVAKDVTGRDDVNVYMSDNNNDLPFNDLERTRGTISFIGDIDYNKIYLDLYGGYIDKDIIQLSNLALLKL